MKPAFVVGLTGGIGSGKSEATREFTALGVECADADDVARAVTAAGTAGQRAVVAEFGPRAGDADGSLDRDWLRRTVFGDEAARLRLERTLHPLIRAELQRQVAAWRGPYGILSVPLLLERGALLPMVSRVLVVDCAEDEQIRRVVRRSALAEAEVRAIMATQIPRAQRLARADDIIDNTGSLASLREQVQRLDAIYRTYAALEPPDRSPENGAQTSNDPELP